MKTALKILAVIGVACALWTISARSELFQAAVVENEKLCTWLKDKTKPDFPELDYRARPLLLEIRELKTGQITCTVQDHGFNESPIETSLIVSVDGDVKMGLRYGRSLHLSSPFIANNYLGFWTY